MNLVSSDTHNMIQLALGFFYLPQRRRDYLDILISFAFFNAEVHLEVCGAVEGDCYGMFPLSSVACDGRDPERSGARKALPTEWRAFIDDLTVIQNDGKVALAELVEWLQMAVKTKESRSLSIVGGSVIHEVFSIAGRKDNSSAGIRCEEFWGVGI